MSIKMNVTCKTEQQSNFDHTAHGDELKVQLYDVQDHLRAIKLAIIRLNERKLDFQDRERQIRSQLADLDLPPVHSLPTLT